MGQVIYAPHGGGPMPLLGDPGYASLAAGLKRLGPSVEGCKAIIVATAHWEGAQPSLTASERPGMLYDYYGFPKAAYTIRYPAPGAPELARLVGERLTQAGFEPSFDAERGYDHGVFVPMALIRPEADIPILQMSLLDSLDPAAHLALGAAFADLLADDIALIGSGFSFHNIQALRGVLPGDPEPGQAEARAFHAWLDETVCGDGLTAEERQARLIDWSSAPGARFCHPREEHLLPLHVCLGAAAAAGMSPSSIFNEPVKGYQTTGYRWT